MSDLGEAPEARAVLRAFAQSGVVVAEAAPALLDRVRPDVVFMLNGLFFAERIIRNEAERRGIRVVTYERGFMPDTLCFSEAIAPYYDIGALWERVRDIPLTPEHEARLDDYVDDRRKGLSAPYNYWSTVREEDREVLAALDLDPGRPIAVLFTNVTWDTGVQDRDSIFPGMYAWVVESIRLFAVRPDVQLVIRIHPAEVKIPGWKTRDSVMDRLGRSFSKLPVNVRVVPPASDLSSYTLMRLARCGLVYMSTAGLEMAMDGMPVVVAGQVHYAGKGFTIDPSDPSEYARLVARALELSRDRAVRDRARRYAYNLFFRYFHEFPLVSENAPDFVPTLKATDPAVLEPGGDPMLDRICEAILGRGDFFVRD